MNLDNFVDVFKRVDYPAGEDGFSRVPFEEILGWLNFIFGEEGWSYEVTHFGTAVGNKGNVENCVAIKLTVPFNGGFISRPGMSQGVIGMSGLICGALNNAVLRHLRAGEGLYERSEETSYAPAPRQATRPAPAPSRKNVYGNPNHENTTRGNGRSYGEWTGEVKVKSGEFAGTPYADLDLNTLEKWCDGGNALALQEMGRREKAGLVTRAPF